MKDMTKDEKIAALRALIQRQLDGLKKAQRDVRESEECLRESLGEFMDLVSPRAPGPERSKT